MKKIYKVQIKLLSPLHINGGTAPDGKRLTVSYDDNGNRKPYIPGTVFKGVTRDNFQMLVKTFEEQYICNGKHIADEPCNCICCKMFGKAGFQRSKIIFDNLETNQQICFENRANIAVNRQLRKVNDKALVFSEAVSNFDIDKNPVVFSGNITAYYDNPDTLKKEEKYLTTAVKLISSIGLGKSRGMGFVEVKIEDEAKSNI